MVKNPFCNARDVGSIPGWGTKIPHTARQLSLWATAREPDGHNERSCMLQLRPKAVKEINKYVFKIKIQMNIIAKQK